MHQPICPRLWRFSIIFLITVLMRSPHAGGNGLPNDVRTHLSGFSLNGYGTLACTADDRSDIAPARDISQEPDDGFNTGSTWKLDSRLGLHAHYRFSQKIDFILQGVLRDQTEFSVGKSVELAYAKLKPHYNFHVRAGRLGYDAFLMSDTRNIGYAYPWVRPPMEFYFWIPIFFVDGMDACYMIDSGNVQWCIRAQAGTSHTDLPLGEDGYSVEADNLWAVTLSRQSGPLTIKLGYSQCDLQNEISASKSLHHALNAVAGATSAAFPGIHNEATYLLSNLTLKDTDITYITMGISYDDGTWIAQAELSHAAITADVIPHGLMGYLALGYRIGDWTPYLIFSMVHPTYDVYKTDADWAAINGDELREAAVDALNSTRMDQKTCSIGGRWDFHDRAAVKLQWDSSYVRPYYGLWWTRDSKSDTSRYINMFTFSLEFMF